MNSNQDSAIMMIHLKIKLVEWHQIIASHILHINSHPSNNAT